MNDSDSYTKEKLQDILDLLRTYTPPDVYNMSIGEWNQYKIEKCSNKLQHLIKEMEGEE